MKKMFTLSILTIAVVFTYAQNRLQTIKGTITDKISEKALAGATVSIDGISASSLSEANGFFIIRNVPAGRVKINISFIGYQPVSIPEVLVTTGKEVIMDIALEQRIASLDEVVVRSSSTRKGNVNNEFAGSSGRSFNIDEVTRYAGGRNDPSKLVSNFAGVVSTNDSRNDIVVRGNSPAGVLWRIEGLPAPSPNHFGTLGTTGGPVSALNTNALKSSDFYTGAFPAEYGNATAAVFDINFRTGNIDKHERTLQLNLFSGLEAMVEGPLNKKGASYLLGYRYSFAQIGQSLGLNVGTEAVPKYQDWVYNVQFGHSKMGRFSLFGMGGISNIDFIGKDIDTTDFYSRKDQDSYFKSRFNLFGGKHTLDMGEKSYLRTVVSYSNVHTGFDNYQYALPLPPYSKRWLVTQVNDNQNILRFSTVFNTKRSAHFSWRMGLTGESFGLKTKVEDKEGKPESSSFDLIRNFDDNFFLLQYFGQVRYKASDKFMLVAGLHGMNFTFNDHHIIEPRASVHYQANAKSTFIVSYGLHGQLQPLPVYLYETQNGGRPDQRNRELDFSKAHHFIVGYENRFAADWRIKAESYYQYLFNIPVSSTPSGFSMLNSGSDFAFPEKAGLINNGTGSNAGVELTIEKFLSDGYYLLTTASVFNSKYKGSDGVKRNSTFNYGYAANLLAGREWKMGRAKRNVFTLDLRMSTLGGRYTTPVDIVKSMAQGKEVLDENNYNSEQLSSYLRLDTKIGFRFNSNKRKLSQTFYLDLQNVTNRKNIFLRRYNPVYATVGNVNQIGFIHEILYSVQF
ncbi:MAG: TonB-dependent receptor [Chitinophagaceae bacterium]